MSNTVRNGFSTINRLLGKKNKDSTLRKSTSNLSGSTINVYTESNKIAPLIINHSAPIEQTFRITVCLPRDQMYVARVGAKTTLKKLLELVCENKQLDETKYEFRHPKDGSQVFTNDLTIGEVGLVEIRLALKTDKVENFTSEELMRIRQNRDSMSSSEYSRFNKQYNKTTSPYSSTTSLNSGDSSSINGTLHRNPVAPRRTKRAAPRPPSQLILNETRTENGDKNGNELNNGKMKTFHTSTPNLLPVKDNIVVVPLREKNENDNSDYAEIKSIQKPANRVQSMYITDHNFSVPTVIPRQAKKKAPKAPQPPPRNGLPPVAPPRTVTPVKFNDDEVHEISLVENDENKREQIVSPSPIYAEVRKPAKQLNNRDENVIVEKSMSENVESTEIHNKVEEQPTIIMNNEKTINSSPESSIILDTKKEPEIIENDVAVIDENSVIELIEQAVDDTKSDSQFDSIPLEIDSSLPESTSTEIINKKSEEIINHQAIENKSDSPIKPIIKERKTIDFNSYKDETPVVVDESISVTTSDMEDGYQGKLSVFSNTDICDDINEIVETSVVKEGHNIASTDKLDGETVKNKQINVMGEGTEDSIHSKNIPFTNKTKNEEKEIEKEIIVDSPNQVNVAVKVEPKEVEQKQKMQDAVIIKPPEKETDVNESFREMKINTPDEAKLDLVRELSNVLNNNEIETIIKRRSSDNDSDIVSPCSPSLSSENFSIQTYSTDRKDDSLTSTLEKSESSRIASPDLVDIKNSINRSKNSNSFDHIIETKTTTIRSFKSVSSNDLKSIDSDVNGNGVIIAENNHMILGRKNSSSSVKSSGSVKSTSSELSIGETPSLQSLNVMKEILSSTKKRNSIVEERPIETNQTVVIKEHHTIEPKNVEEEVTLRHKSVTVLNTENIREETNPRPISPPQTTWKYTGPPSISLSTWNERPKVEVAINPDSDYKLGGVARLSSKFEFGPKSNTLSYPKKVEKKIETYTESNVRNSDRFVPAVSVTKIEPDSKPNRESDKQLNHVPAQMSNVNKSTVTIISNNERVDGSKSVRPVTIHGMQWKTNVAAPTVHGFKVGTYESEHRSGGVQTVNTREFLKQFSGPSTSMSKGQVTTVNIEKSASKETEPEAQVPFSQNTLRKTAFRDKITSDVNSVPVTVNKEDQAVSAVAKESLKPIGASQPTVTCPPPPPPAVVLKTPVIRGVVVKKQVDADPRDQLLAAIRNFKWDNVRKDK